MSKPSFSETAPSSRRHLHEKAKAMPQTFLIPTTLSRQMRCAARCARRFMTLHHWRQSDPMCPNPSIRCWHSRTFCIRMIFQRFFCISCCAMPAAKTRLHYIMILENSCHTRCTVICLRSCLLRILQCSASQKTWPTPASAAVWCIFC